MVGSRSGCTASRARRATHLAVAAADTRLAQTALESMGLMVVIAFADVTFGGCAVSRLSVIGGGQLNTVDLVRPRSVRYATAMMRRTLRGSLRGQELRVVSPEDFVILKILATRERDLEDARSVLEKQRGRIDTVLVEHEVARLAAELTGHDVRGRFDTVVA